MFCELLLLFRSVFGQSFYHYVKIRKEVEINGFKKKGAYVDKRHTGELSFL